MFLYFLLDLMMYNYTSLYSYFFLTNLKVNKKWEVIITIILMFIVTHSLILPIYVLCAYVVCCYINFKDKLFINNLLFNLLNYLIFILIFSLFYNKNIIDIFINSFGINLLFFVISYFFMHRSISFNR